MENNKEKESVLVLPKNPDQDKTIDEIVHTGITFDDDEPVTIEKPEEEVANDIHNKVIKLEIGKIVTVIYGDINNQKLINGRVLSLTDKVVTVSNENDPNKQPNVVQIDTIIDIFEVKRFKKEKEKFSLYKFGRQIGEFFSGTEEERTERLEQKIREKELKKRLKEDKKNEDK